jgi:lipopolysaccharide transport system permease protein
MQLANEETASQVITVEPHVSAAFELRELWASRELLYFLMWRDIKVRYKQTLIGVGWTILQPLMAMVVLTVVFGNAARLPSEGIPYPLFAYAGLLAWTFFANALFSSSNSLVGNGPLITKIYFPRLLVPAGAVGARLVDFGIAALLMAVLMAWYRAPVTPRLLLLPLLVVITMMLSLACGMWLSALNVKYRDVNFALPHVLQFVMFATPVFYSSTMLPGRWRWMAKLNPIAVLIEGYRAALFGRPFDWPALSACAAFAVVLLVAAGTAFRTMEEEFADLV